ncbi:hypothetical protein [Mangrovicella endophytica]|uniref:hypothetical protein n=1 Tax=Mangrovicella endophytica TaxID=2066697 RepID=UPI001FE0137C|nr:hypothetical protein [Mangrovicella endophytica]
MTVRLAVEDGVTATALFGASVMTLLSLERRTRPSAAVITVMPSGTVICARRGYLFLSASIITTLPDTRSTSQSLAMAAGAHSRNPASVATHKVFDFTDGLRPKTRLSLTTDP